MKTRIFLITLFCCFLSINIEAQKITNDVATTAGGFDIPIIIRVPDNAKGKLPVVFYVHGGGWNGGNNKKVPKATLPRDADFLGDDLGIVYVGLAYRCKGNNGTFALAIEDLEASVKWFSERADSFNADMSKIGFAGSSAGTTLSAIMAQKYPNCVLYLGAEGMYNIVDLDNNLSHFPNEKSRQDYGLVTDEEKRNASPYYNLRDKPASALLLHGSDDWLCHFTQSEKYAAKIIEAGGEAKVIVHDAINHNSMSRAYPEAFKVSLKAITALYIKEFGLKNVDLKKIENKTNRILKNNYPSENIDESKLLGTWNWKKEHFTFQKNGKGFYKKGKKEKMLTYTFNNKSFEVQVEGEPNKRLFYLRKNENVIYEYITLDTRWKSRRNNYKKQ